MSEEKRYWQHSVRVLSRPDELDSDRHRLAKAHASHALLERLLQTTPDSCITIWPAKPLVTTTDAEYLKDYTTLVAHGMVHNVTNAKLEVTRKEVEKLVTDFARKHYNPPTHLLLPPGTVFRETYYIIKENYAEFDPQEPAAVRLSSYSKEELKIVPNAPMLAVAIL